MFFFFCDDYVVFNQFKTANSNFDFINIKCIWQVTVLMQKSQFFKK